MQNNKQLGIEGTFNFIEITDIYSENNLKLVNQIKNRNLDGFIAKSLLSEEEVTSVVNFLSNLNEELYMQTPSGKIFPRPFAIITDIDEKLNEYKSYIEILNERKNSNAAIKLIFDKLDKYIKFCSSGFKVSNPVIKVNDVPVSEGTFRYLFKEKGGLYVHSGNYFQEQNEFFYSVIKNDIDMNDQLSYFIVLQNSEDGGELTLYDLIWEKGQTKDNPHNNEFVFLKDGSKVYIKDLSILKLKPKAGDLLMFYGGYIWHRVEDIKGDTPRITLGGFLNFSKDGKELFYWS